MKRAYEHTQAEALVPLLRAIHRELRDRALRVRFLSRRVPELEPGLERDMLEAELSTHRRELRRANEELERLGCALDDDHPGRVLIPGWDGELEHGYSWQVGETRVRGAALDASA